MPYFDRNGSFFFRCGYGQQLVFRMNPGLEQTEKARSKCLRLLAPQPKIEAVASDIKDTLEQINVSRP
ncbi:hypothetical protein [Sinorhizobium medicae]|uniref:hypothetical protein n=1 Tax=Sinorhizobium medicae TaxID=110321 RepID=UPI0013E2DB8D|nr:hypothetical protein [Sinorhizobium medicae]MDX0888007.1 hypothetical protein [Sinorhizobium medicae]